MPPDSRDFDRYLQEESLESVVQFANLGGDAQLIVPTPRRDSLANYSHIAAFTRSAPMEQQCALWRQVGRGMQERVGEKPIWLNTAGGGVAWLHIRLDDSPKYYRHSAYVKGV